jgi:hypothetical protein
MSNRYILLSQSGINVSPKTVRRWVKHCAMIGRGVRLKGSRGCEPQLWGPDADEIKRRILVVTDENRWEEFTDEDGAALVWVAEASRYGTDDGVIKKWIKAGLFPGLPYVPQIRHFWAQKAGQLHERYYIRRRDLRAIAAARRRRGRKRGYLTIPEFASYIGKTTKQVRYAIGRFHPGLDAELKPVNGRGLATRDKHLLSQADGERIKKFDEELTKLAQSWLTTREARKDGEIRPKVHLRKPTAKEQDEGFITLLGEKIRTIKSWSYAAKGGRLQRAWRYNREDLLALSRKRLALAASNYTFVEPDPKTGEPREFVPVTVVRAMGRTDNQMNYAHSRGRVTRIRKKIPLRGVSKHRLGVLLTDKSDVLREISLVRPKGAPQPRLPDGRFTSIPRSASQLSSQRAAPSATRRNEAATNRTSDTAKLPIDVKKHRVIVAIGVLRDHPDWSDRRIAKEVGIAQGNLSRSELYQKAKLALRNAASPRTGYRDSTGNVTAIHKDADE